MRYTRSMTDLPVPMPDSSDVLLQLFWQRLSRRGHIPTGVFQSHRDAARRIVAAVGPSARAVVLVAAFADEFALDLEQLADDLEYPEETTLAYTPRPPTGRALVAAIAVQHGLDHRQGGNLRGAERYYRWAVQQFQVLNEPEAESFAWTLLGGVVGLQERQDEAGQCFSRALVLDQATGDTFNARIDLGLLGQVAWLTGRLDDAEHYCRQALALHRRAEDRLNPTSTFTTLGEVAKERGQQGRARLYSGLSALAKAWPLFTLRLAFLLGLR